MTESKTDNPIIENYDDWVEGRKKNIINGSYETDFETASFIKDAFKGFTLFPVATINGDKYLAKSRIIDSSDISTVADLKSLIHAEYGTDIYLLDIKKSPTWVFSTESADKVLLVDDRVHIKHRWLIRVLFKE